MFANEILKILFYKGFKEFTHHVWSRKRFISSKSSICVLVSFESISNGNYCLSSISLSKFDTIGEGVKKKKKFLNKSHKKRKNKTGGGTHFVASNGSKERKDKMIQKNFKKMNMMNLAVICFLFFLKSLVLYVWQQLKALALLANTTTRLTLELPILQQVSPLPHKKSFILILKSEK